MIAAILLLLSNAFKIPSLYDPTQFELITTRSVLGNSVQFKRRFGLVADFLLLGSSLFQGIAALQTISTWLDLLTNFTEKFPENKCFSSRNIKLGISSVTVLTFIVFILMASAQLIDEISVLFVVGATIGTVFYTIGYFRLVRNELIIEFCLVDENLKKPFRHIRFNYQINLLSLCVILVCSLIGFVLVLDFKRTLKLGSLNYILVIFDVAHLFGLLLLFNTLFYCYRINSMVKKKKKFNPLNI